MTRTRSRDLVVAMQRICMAMIAVAVVGVLAACADGPGGEKPSDENPPAEM
jgi:hypothetical protein